MASRKTHCEDCFRILGHEFDHVHAWLDAKAAEFPPPLFLEYHRKFRHNDKGVKIVRKKWGLLAAEAAKIHLIRDLEIYVLKEEFSKVVTYENVDELYNVAKRYCHNWQGPLNEDVFKWVKKR